MTDSRTFPPGFIWGTAAAAYQIEGAVAEGGRAPSIWDTFSHTPGKVDKEDTGDIACDHFHRWPADLDLMAELGIASYRFSVSWPRVMPDGRTVNAEGVEFYDRLVDGLLERGIQPLMTLYHWDLPQALEDEGGWLNRDIADRFTDYALTMGKAVGDRTPAVTTLNEPWCSAYLGYATGEHAPGLTDQRLAFPVAHHLNLAHGRAVTALRGLMSPETEFSVTLNLHQIDAASDSDEDVRAARRADGVANRIFLDPMLRGGYPEDLLEDSRHLTDWSFVRDGDEAEIAAPIDFLGVNYYSPVRISAEGSYAWPGSDDTFAGAIPGPSTIMGWPIQPSGLTDLLVRVHEDYGVPMMVTENGCAMPDEVGTDGIVHDDDRIAYIDGHLGAILDAVDAGADLRGYYVWTFMDNFEWAWGYDKRFGIVHVDYETQVRTPKDSARWYESVIRDNALPAR